MYGGRSLLGNYQYDGFEFLQGDIRSPDTVQEALDGVDAVVHLAAIVGDPASARQPDLAREVNLDASLQLFEFCRDRDVDRFIFASTCSNYGKMEDPSQPVTEDSELRPVSLYAENKVAVENKLLAAPAAQSPAVTVLRFATVYGLSPRMRFDLTVNEFTMELLIRRRLEVYGEQFWRPYIHVRDAARAVAMALDLPTETVAGKVLNVGDDGQNYRKGQIVDLICTRIGDGLTIERVRKDEDPRDYRVSFEKIKRETGFSITRRVEDGIREVMAAITQGVIDDFDNPSYRN